jgi:ribosomal protein S27AE
MKPKQQKKKRRKLICPRCGKGFHQWQHAEKHAAELRHWGNFR